MKSRTKNNTECGEILRHGKHAFGDVYGLMDSVMPVLVEAEVDDPGLIDSFFDEAILPSIEGVKTAVEVYARKQNCQIEYLIGKEATRAVCNSKDCPFYPNGPEATL